ADLFHVPQMANAPVSELLQTVRPMANEGRGRRLVDQFQVYQEHANRRELGARGQVRSVGIAEAQDKIRHETEAMFLDRVLIRIKDTELPDDVVLVDLPGVSVPNPRHREVTFRFVKQEAHAIVFVLMATRL